MSLLGKLPDTNQPVQSVKAWPSKDSADRLLSWLVSRQTSLLHDEEYPIPIEAAFRNPLKLDEKHQPDDIEIASVVPPECLLPDENEVEPSGDQLEFAGMTGRCNKPADTCYTFWAGGSLAVSIIPLFPYIRMRWLLSPTSY